MVVFSKVLFSNLYITSANGTKQINLIKDSTEQNRTSILGRSIGLQGGLQFINFDFVTGSQESKIAILPF